MRKIEPIAATVPYMVVAGNHEIWFNFSAYVATALGCVTLGVSSCLYTHARTHA